jgi:hypothetical protein
MADLWVMSPSLIAARLADTAARRPAAIPGAAATMAATMAVTDL